MEVVGVSILVKGTGFSMCAMGVGRALRGVLQDVERLLHLLGRDLRGPAQGRRV